MRSKDISLKPLNDILEKYGDEVQDVLFNSLDKVAKETVKELKANSPYRTGEYAKGWTKTKHMKDWQGIKVIVYNKTKPTLTGLLNDGYVNKTGHRDVEVKGDKHIDMAEDYAIERLEEIVMKELSNL